MNGKLNVSSQNRIDINSQTQNLEKLQRKIDKSSIKWGGRGIAKEVKYGFQKIAHFFKTFTWESNEQRALSQIHKDFKILDQNLDHMNNKPIFTEKSLEDYKNFTEQANKQLEIMKSICSLVATHPNKINEEQLSSIEKDINTTKYKIEFNLHDVELRKIIETNQNQKDLENIQNKLENLSIEAWKGGCSVHFLDKIKICLKIIDFQLDLNQLVEEIKNTDSKKLYILTDYFLTSIQIKKYEIFTINGRSKNQKEIIDLLNSRVRLIANELLKQKYELIEKQSKSLTLDKTNNDIDNLKTVIDQLKKSKKTIMRLKPLLGDNTNLLKKISNSIQKCDSKIMQIKEMKIQIKKYETQIEELEEQLNEPKSAKAIAEKGQDFETIKVKLVTLRNSVEKLPESDKTLFLKKIDDSLQKFEHKIYGAKMFQATQQLDALNNEFNKNQNYYGIKNKLINLEQFSSEIKDDKLHKKINKLLSKCEEKIIEVEKIKKKFVDARKEVEKLGEKLNEVLKKGFTLNASKIEKRLIEISESVKNIPIDENYSEEITSFKNRISELLEICRLNRI